MDLSAVRTALQGAPERWVATLSAALGRTWSDLGPEALGGEILGWDPPEVWTVERRRDDEVLVASGTTTRGDVMLVARRGQMGASGVVALGSAAAVFGAHRPDSVLGEVLDQVVCDWLAVVAELVR